MYDHENFTDGKPSPTQVEPHALLTGAIYPNLTDCIIDDDGIQRRRAPNSGDVNFKLTMKKATAPILNFSEFEFKANVPKGVYVQG
ncbi:hypothetical protein ACTXT7_012136 [Hymenolepis weldensis]